MNAALAPASREAEKGVVTRLALYQDFSPHRLRAYVQIGESLLVTRTEDEIRAFLFDEKSDNQLFGEAFEHATEGRLITTTPDTYSIRTFMREGLSVATTHSDYANAIETHAQWTFPHSRKGPFTYTIRNSNPATLQRNLPKESHGHTRYLEVQQIPMKPLRPISTHE
jgi:hypothetical protein